MWADVDICGRSCLSRFDHDDVVLDPAPSGTFNIQVYSNEAQLLNEYTLDAAMDNVTSLRAAEQRARVKLHKNIFEPLVLVVSEETITEFNQIQIRVPATTADAEQSGSQKDNNRATN